MARALSLFALASCAAAAASSSPEDVNHTVLMQRSMEYVKAGGGWMSRLDAAATVLLSRFQHAIGLDGAVGEIGVGHGAFFGLLAATAGGSEELFAVDVFEGGAHGASSGSSYGHSSRAANLSLFLKHVERVVGKGRAHNVSVYKMSSLELPSYRAKIPESSCRFISIDGGHLEALAFSDLRWASSSLIPGGIVALDDYANRAWPGVARALGSFFHLVDPSYSRLRPLLATDRKLFLTTASHHAQYLHVMELLADPLALIASQADTGDMKWLAPFILQQVQHAWGEIKATFARREMQIKFLNVSDGELGRQIDAATSTSRPDSAWRKAHKSKYHVPTPTSLPPPAEAFEVGQLFFGPRNGSRVRTHRVRKPRHWTRRFG